MKVKVITPRVSNFLQVKLDKNIIDYLWQIIDNSKKTQQSHKKELVGNISKSFLLEDLDSFFYKSVCIPLVNCYRENNPVSKGYDPDMSNPFDGTKAKLLLKSLWVNYQYKNEFNPLHQHKGVYSFVIWMKIPYSWDEQIKLPQFRDIKKQDIKAGNFMFAYTDTLGDVITTNYNLTPEYEGCMLLFPARLRHCVYPFYETDDPRISIAGNLSFSPDYKKG